MSVVRDELWIDVACCREPCEAEAASLVAGASEQGHALRRGHDGIEEKESAVTVSAEEMSELLNCVADLPMPAPDVVEVAILCGRCVCFLVTLSGLTCCADEQSRVSFAAATPCF